MKVTSGVPIPVWRAGACDPNETPRGIDLAEIRAIARRGAAEARHLVVRTSRCDIAVLALPTVHFSDEFGDSRYFAARVPRYVRGRFLEIGAGTGVVSVAVAVQQINGTGSSRDTNVATDINLAAVRNVELNAVINGVEDKIQVRRGHVFRCLHRGEKFDCIFWNHPFHRGRKTESMVQRACFDPHYGGLNDYVRDGHKFLRKGGKLLLGSGNFADLDEMRRIMAKHGCRMDLLHYIHRPFNVTHGELKTFNIYEIRKVG
jgi:hypothetical protein